MILCIRSPLKTVSILSDVYDRELVATIGWAKQVSWPMVIMISLKRDSDDNYDHCTVIQVPGFTDLTLNDQMKLLQSSWTEVAELFTNLSVIPTRFNSFREESRYQIGWFFGKVPKGGVIFHPKKSFSGFGNVKQGFFSMKLTKRKVISGFRVCFFNNCIDNNWY